MSQDKTTARPWSVAVETEAEDGLTITIPEIGRCLHDWEWADAEEWERDLANADLIVTAVNEREALLSEVAQLREAAQVALRAIGAPISALACAGSAPTPAHRATGRGKGK